MAGPAADVDVYLKQILQRMIETGEWQRCSLLVCQGLKLQLNDITRLKAMFTAQLDESGWTDQLRSSGRKLADEMDPLSIHDMLTDLNMNAHKSLPADARRSIQDAVRAYLNKQFE
ncbi:hypothetical protein EDD18DRAFT_1104051 [Armillaria luteobubalina]|uniref:Transcription and mRNA export factor SUS1 n=1 Tax=Armillaria luteobubalina TaxID=153913 RepID=A0AA39QB74_9AGAR|nr:hypothetical protein EDD18DRAFT_1104051 [Armillaria luteobubalina]